MSERADDIRRAALGAYGGLRFLRRVQGGVEDVEGAIQAGQYGAAAAMARSVVLLCLSIHSLAHGGEIDLDEESLSFDPFDRVPEPDVADAIALASAALALDADSAAAWLERFQAYVAQTERLLGYDAKLPLLRSPEGAFGLIGIARRWGPVLEALGLPPALPARWAAPKSAQDKGG